jgi:uncharacterized protein (DUF885 family)
MNDLDLLAPDLQQLLQLFSSLPDVRFPDLDAGSLQDDVARVKERHLELMHIEAQLQAVRTALEEEHEALLKKGHRLHAYLEVFAQSDDALAAKVGALTLPRLKRSAAVARPVEASSTEQAPGAELAPAPRKRGRPRKVVPATSDALFAATDA